MEVLFACSLNRFTDDTDYSMFKLDCCNSALTGLSNGMVQCSREFRIRRRVLFFSCRNVTTLFSDSLQRLYWLPICSRIAYMYKLCTPLYTDHNGKAPVCISELINTVVSVSLSWAAVLMHV